jgi:hypothetical protein
MKRAMNRAPTNSLSEIRAWPRYQVSARVEASDPLSGRSINGRTSNISRGGCYALTAEPLPTGIVMQLRIEYEGALFETLACVIRTVPGEGIGFAFLDAKTSQMDLLERWLNELAGNE